MRTREVKKEQELIWESYAEEGQHWSEMPANKALENFKKAIVALEPAGDVREFYKDAITARIDAKILNDIVIKAVKDGDLSEQEAHFITDGAVGEHDPSDVGHRGFDKEEGFFGPREVEEEGGEMDLGSIRYQRTRKIVDMVANKYPDIFNDPDADPLDVGRELWGQLSPELSYDIDQNELIDIIEDKLAEAGMRPKESTIQPFDQFYEQD